MAGYMEIRDAGNNNITNACGCLNKVVVDMMGKEDSIEIDINERLTIRVKRDEDGYSVDLYKYLPPEEETEEHDFDGDFIDSITVSEDQLEPVDL